MAEPVGFHRWSERMLSEIAEFRICGQHRIEVRFTDGVAGVVDLSDLVGHGVFAPLRDPAEFARAGLDEFGVLCWPDGADLACAAMHDALRRAQFWRPALARSAMPA